MPCVYLPGPAPAVTVANKYVFLYSSKFEVLFPFGQIANETKQNKKAWMLSCEGVLQCFNPLILPIGVFSYRGVQSSHQEVLNSSTHLCKYVFCPSIQMLLHVHL